MDFENILLLMSVLAENAIKKETERAKEELKAAIRNQIKNYGIGCAESLIMLQIFLQALTELKEEIKA